MLCQSRPGISWSSMPHSLLQGAEDEALGHFCRVGINCLQCVAMKTVPAFKLSELSDISFFFLALPVQALLWVLKCHVVTLAVQLHVCEGSQVLLVTSCCSLQCFLASPSCSFASSIFMTYTGAHALCLFGCLS
jgi:hypothetical protein